MRHAYGNAYGHANTDFNANGDADSYSDAYGYTDGDSHGHGDANANADSHSYGHFNTDSNAYACGQTYADAQAAADDSSAGAALIGTFKGGNSRNQFASSPPEADRSSFVGRFCETPFSWPFRQKRRDGAYALARSSRDCGRKQNTKLPLISRAVL